MPGLREDVPTAVKLDHAVAFDASPYFDYKDSTAELPEPQHGHHRATSDAQVRRRNQ